jgi:hypothetical protein
MRGKPTSDTKICFTEVRIHHRVNPSLCRVLLLEGPIRLPERRE